MLHKIVVDPGRSNYVQGTVEKGTLVDEIDFVQYGQQKEINFERMAFGQPEPSILFEWPTKTEPEKVYKFTSIWLEQGLQEQILERQTYSFLEWLGDVGGLFDGLHLLVGFVVAPISAYALKQRLMGSTFSSTL